MRAMYGCARNEAGRPVLRCGSIKAGSGFLILLLGVFLLAALLSLSGCTVEEQADPAAPPAAKGSHLYYMDLPTLGPAVLKILVANPLSIESEPVSLPGQSWNEVIFIGGLVDSQVEVVINGALEQAYEKLQEPLLPPYRGIYRAVPDGSELTAQSLHSYAAFNYNNILSVHVSSDLTYELPVSDEENYESGSYDYFSPIIIVGQLECLNFDLRSGRQIMLPELFADPSAAMDLINDAVAKILAGKNADDEFGFDMTPYDIPRPTGPFKGLAADQKFYLSNWGIYLVIDYLNPEFDQRFYPSQIYLPFSLFDGSMVIEKRFEAERKAIYLDSESMEMEFVQREYHDLDSAAMVRFEETDYIGAVQTYLFYHYPANLPGALELRVREMRSEAEANIARLKDDYPEGVGENLFLDLSISVNRMGPYYILRYHGYSWGFDGAGSYLIMECYSEDGRLLELADCFKPGFNYREALYGAYIEQSGWLGDNILSLEELFETLTFAFGPTELEFTVNAAGEYYFYYIPYRDIGFENLTIFDL